MRYFFLVFLCALPAFAKHPWQRFDGGGSDFTSEAMGNLCFTFDPFEDHLPCNPSFLAFEREPKLQLDMGASESVGEVSDSYDLIDGRNGRSLENDLISGRKNFSALGGFEASYAQKLWGVSWVPRRVAMQTTSYQVPVPTVEIQGLSEQSARAQIATYLAGDYSVGLQARVTDRQGIYGEYSALDQEIATSESPFERKTRTFFTLEPGMVFQPLNSWDGRVTAMFRNLGISKRGIDDLVPDPSAVIGASISPYFGPIKFHLGISGEFYERPWDDYEEQVTVGSGITIKKLSLFAANQEHKHMLSLLFSPGSIVLGVVYTEEELSRAQRETSMYYKVGLQF